MSFTRIANINRDLSSPGSSEASRVKPDPPIRKDQRCAVCHGIRGRTPKTITQRKKAGLIIELAADPFCSSKCARDWHGTSLKGQPEKAPAADLDWSHA